MLITRANLAQAIETLKEENVWVVGLDQDGETVGEKTKRHLAGATALVVGSEGEGIRQLTRAKCDIVLKLPMRGQVESLNAAVAGSVALYLAYLARNTIA
jgi:23S rRNA (guanosine2251-2'-O)-methyltransferase